VEPDDGDLSLVMSYDQQDNGNDEQDHEKGEEDGP
jgi:hypothetical protein